MQDAAEGSDRATASVRLDQDLIDKATIMANAISVNKTIGMLDKFSLFISLHLFLIRLFCLNRTGRFTPSLSDGPSELAQYSILEITM